MYKLSGVAIHFVHLISCNYYEISVALFPFIYFYTYNLLQ